ncbi:hypothetical protein [Parasitella parasitica]|uniref:Uncharacterized protein n=1 Tax=Parasitella parasitica TaxID=35722 RepID=A0A0B7NAY2_9FUNG|nr:hypothetical protein [Parasitella parasitica]
MLPQFGYIVAQAGADYYSLPRSPPPPAVPQTSPGSIMTQSQQPAQQSQPPTSSLNHKQQAQGNGSISALAPLLNNKPFGFGGGSSSSSGAVQSSSSSTPSSSNDNYYKSNTSNGNFNTPPYYSRQPSPSPSSSNIPILPPPSFLYSAAKKENIPKAGFQQPNVLPVLEKKKETSWYASLPPAQQEPSPVAAASQANTIPTPTHHYSHHHHHHQHPQQQQQQHRSPQPLPPPPIAFQQQQQHQQQQMHHSNHPLYHIKANSPPQRVDSPFYDRPVIEDDRNVQPVSHLNKWQDKSSTTKSSARKEYNDLMTWMDNEFWERSDEIYQDKISQLKQELAQLQKGTHSAFREIMADYETQREKSIHDAESFMKYQIEFIDAFYDQDLNALEDEYENERKQIQDTLINSIEDKRKQMREDREENNEEEPPNSNTRAKRNLRKRNAESINVKATEPTSKRKAVRPSTLPNIHTISSIEEEELENEYLFMKRSFLSSASAPATVVSAAATTLNNNNSTKLISR